MQTWAYAEHGGDEAWDFVDDEDLLLSFGGRAARANMQETVAFGPAPSADEAAEAVQLLRESLYEYVTVPAERVLSASYPGPSLAEEKDVEPDSASDVAQATARLVAAARANTSLGRRRDVVRQALHLLSTNDSMQQAVQSLACDPAVWNAVNNNAEVRKLLGDSARTPEPSSPPEVPSNGNCQRLLEGDHEQADGDNLGSRLRQMLRRFLDAVTGFKENFLERLTRLFGLLSGEQVGSKGDGEGDKEDVVQMVAGLVVLVVLVLGIIVLKRPSLM